MKKAVMHKINTYLESLPSLIHATYHKSFNHVAQLKEFNLVWHQLREMNVIQQYLLMI